MHSSKLELKKKKHYSEYYMSEKGKPELLDSGRKS